MPDEDVNNRQANRYDRSMRTVPIEPNQTKPILPYRITMTRPRTATPASTCARRRPRQGILPLMFSPVFNKVGTKFSKGRTEWAQEF
jgi:hypothetical protein